MKTRIGICILAASISSAVLAQGNSKGNNEDIPNGQPFQALETLIEENSVLIEANSGAIAELEIEVTELRSDLNDISVDLSGLQLQVDTNSDAIANAMALIRQNTSDIGSLRRSLNSLASSTRKDISSLRRQIDSINLQMRQMISRNSHRISDLSSQLYGLRQQVQNNTASINPLITDIAILQNEILLNANSISALQNESVVLTNTVSQLEADVDTLENEMANIKDRVSTLEGYHYDIAVGATATGSLTTDDQLSMVRTGWVSGSNIYVSPYADYYTFEVSSTSTVTIDLASPELGSNGSYGAPNFFDTYLYLHEGDCVDCQIAFDDDRGPGLNSQISTTLQPGVYTIEVTSYRGDATGDYQLSVQ